MVIVLKIVLKIIYKKTELPEYYEDSVHYMHKFGSGKAWNHLRPFPLSIQVWLKTKITRTGDILILEHNCEIKNMYR